MSENEEIVMNDVESDYIEKIKELKASSVSREDYDRVRADNKKLLDAIVNGQSQVIDSQKEEKPKVDIQALRNDLYSGRKEMSDLEYVSKTLQLRKAIMEAGGDDPAVGRGQKVTPTDIDYKLCADTCDALQEIVDYADGDPAVFRAEYMRRVKF